jgi:hypothetical protein
MENLSLLHRFSINPTFRHSFKRPIFHRQAAVLASNDAGVVFMLFGLGEKRTKRTR